jgi:hypothetical protein
VRLLLDFCKFYWTFVDLIIINNMGRNYNENRAQRINLISPHLFVSLQGTAECTIKCEWITL